MKSREDAALARAAQVRTLSDRPSQRRADEHGPSNFTHAVRAQFELRSAADGSAKLHFTGHASVYETPYEMWDIFGPYTEIVSAGAASECLKRTDLDVPLVLDHDPIRRIASTVNGSLTVSEDAVGLLVDAPALDPEDKDVEYIAPKMLSGLIYEMSFRFRITSGAWSPDYTEYRINAFDIHRGDVSIVGYGANPYTTSTLKPAAMSAPVEELSAKRGNSISDADVTQRELALL